MIVVKMPEGIMFEGWIVVNRRRIVGDNSWIKSRKPVGGIDLW